MSGYHSIAEAGLLCCMRLTCFGTSLVALCDDFGKQERVDPSLAWKTFRDGVWISE